VSRGLDGAADGRWILAFDTATTEAVVALRELTGRGGTVVDRWPAGFRHGEELLARIDRLSAATGVGLGDAMAVAVGTGPGAFTGLRVGVATAKGLAHALGVPLIGIATTTAILAAARAGGVEDPIGLFLPAGPSDLVVVATDRAGRASAARRLGPGDEAGLVAGSTVVAVDLVGRLDDAASAAGEAARSGLGAALAELAVARLAVGAVDDLAALVPEYVTLPRGVTREGGQVTLARG
jgi:tRNA threonylcarbamoyl adenosine modification protein YeaZ